MSRTSNDDRSDSMNPNNDTYWDSLDNHANQLNPNNDAYQGAEGVSRTQTTELSPKPHCQTFEGCQREKTRASALTSRTRIGGAPSLQCETWYPAMR